VVFGASDNVRGIDKSIRETEPILLASRVSIHNHDPDSLAFDRLLFFSDAVFAIAMTLPAIDIRVPQSPEGGDMAQLWTAHHQLFRYIVQYDSALVGLNMVFLLLIAFLPVPTSHSESTEWGRSLSCPDAGCAI
jgi:Endosomal/lysosomal potassium channel TMEM175